MQPMPRQPNPLRSDLGWSTADRIVVRGKDLPGELLGKINLGDMAFLELMGRVPTPQESTVFNAILVTLVEHGVTPSALAARLTYAGAPESLQAAVAAGLCGLGTVFVGSMEGVARLLAEALPRDRAKTTTQAELETIARDTVAAWRARKQPIPGLGHPIHKPIDPRTPRLFQIARENGFAGAYVQLVQLVAAEAERAAGKQLPINATGAIGAICCELGVPDRVVRGLGVMARAVGLVGHLLEETERPMALEVWQRVDDEASAHARPKSR
jgi:citrate synthase